MGRVVQQKHSCKLGETYRAQTLKKEGVAGSLFRNSDLVCPTDKPAQLLIQQGLRPVPVLCQQRRPGVGDDLEPTPLGGGAALQASAAEASRAG